MIVVADTSPFVALVNIGCVHVLPGLFDRVVIPEEVARALGDARRPDLVRRFIEARPEWLDVRQPTRLLDLPGIDPGEVAAISLAVELRAGLLIVDDRPARQAASARDIPVVHTTAMLLDAANAGLIDDLRSVFDRLAATDFRVSPGILATLLARHDAVKGRSA